MFNKIILVGNLTREPEIKYLPSGTCVANFSVATSEKQKDKEVTCFIDCVVFGGLAEKVVQPYLNKGSQVYIIGRLKLDQWTDQSGGKRSKHSVTVETMQMLGTKEDSQSNNTQTNQAPQQGNYYQNQQQQTKRPAPTVEVITPGIPDIDINDDEIPF